MKSLFFLDIDTQRDLMLPQGSLPVPGAERLAPRLRRLFGFAKANEVTVLSTVLSHDSPDPGPSRFPPHCVRGTEGQRKVDDTLMLHPLVLENKPVDRSFHDMVRKHPQIIIERDGFDIFSNPAVEKLLRVLPPHAIVFGVPTEHSVLLATLGLRRLRFKTAVIANAILPLEPRKAAKAEAEMRGAGVEFIALEVLLGVQAAE